MEKAEPFISLAECERLEAIAAKAHGRDPRVCGACKEWNERWEYDRCPNCGELDSDIRPFALQLEDESRTALPALIAQHKRVMDLLEQQHVACWCRRCRKPGEEGKGCNVGELIRAWKEKG